MPPTVIPFPQRRVKRPSELQKIFAVVEAAHKNLPGSKRPSKGEDMEFARLLHAALRKNAERSRRETPEQTQARCRNGLIEILGEKGAASLLATVEQRIGRKL